MRHSRRALMASAALAACGAGDASIHLTWTINGETATATRCDAVGAAWVRIVEDEDGDGAVDKYFRQMACSEGSGETARLFDSAQATDIAFELGQLGGTVLEREPATGFRAFDPVTGSNDITVDFTVSP